MKAVAKEERRVAYPLVLIFAILSLGIVTVGTLYYRNYERQFRAGVERQLSAVAELKASELVHWRKERLGDGAVFFGNGNFADQVRRFLENPADSDAQAQLRTWLRQVQAAYGYDRVFLLDAQGVERLSVPDTPEPFERHLAQDTVGVQRSGEVAFLDFHRDSPDRPVHLAVLVPILDESDANRPLGVLVLRIDPTTYLYPFIKRWPTFSQTAETLLIRREGNEAVFLNELRFQTNTALNLHISLENTNMPAVKAALGQEGIVEGVDYRGEPVIADVRAIPDTPWFLVTRMDTAEVYAPVHERLWLTILLVSLLLIGAGAGIGVIWRHQRVQFYKERYKMAEALREGEARYRAVVDSANDAIVTINTAGEIAGWNGAAQKIFHYTAAEMLGQPLVRILPRAGHNHFFTDLQRIQAGGSPLILDKAVELAGQREDGSVFPMEISVAEWRVSGERFFTGTMRDITARKRAEVALNHEQTLMTTLMKTLPDPVYFKDAASRFLRVNPALARKLGLGDPAQLVGKTDADFFTEEHASKALADEQEIIRTGQPLVNIEEKETWPDGSETWVLTTKLPLRDDAGRIIGTCGISSNITEIKRAEETLRLSEERLLKVITQTRCILHSGQVEGPEGWRERALEPESPFHWDFPVLNEEAAQKILPLEQAAGERYQEAWFRSRNRDDCTQMNWNAGNAFLNDLPFYRNVFRCIDKHGVGHWMQEFVTVRKLAENRWELFGITTDISDLKRVETELRRSETGLQATLESTADGILAVDNKGKVIKANRRFTELWRIPQSLMDAGDDHALLDFVLKQLSDPDAFLKKEQSLYGTDAVEMDTLAFKDGRIFERYYFPMMMEGAVLGRVWSFRDITERKQAAQRVADALNFNQTMLRALPVGIVVFKATGPCVSANEAIGQIIGGSREEVLKQNFRQLESWKDSGMLAAAEAALAAQTERKLETQIVTTFGRKAWFFCRFVPFQYEGEQHLLLIISDITERKRQENELSEKNSELERFTYTVSHDLKSPLVTVKTFLGYLEQDLARPDMERVKQDVAYMHTATEKMGQLLDELLNLARVGRKENPAVRVTFRELAQEAVRLVAGRISTGAVKVQVADAVVTLEGDRPRLMEIWQNLVENACKFMGNQPQPQVEIGVEKRGSETVFFVRDNGAGIDPRYQAKVFGLFEQLNPKGEGTGMGLALVKRIVELYEGRIWVESAGPGQGANFLFTLPGAVILEPEQSS
jgi:PAS domain S-box-containing protein